MQLRFGLELIYSFPQPTPIIFHVNVHYSRAFDIIVPDRLTTEPFVPVTGYDYGASAPLPCKESWHDAGVPLDQCEHDVALVAP